MIRSFSTAEMNWVNDVYIHSTFTDFSIAYVDYASHGYFFVTLSMSDTGTFTKTMYNFNDASSNYKFFIWYFVFTNSETVVTLVGGITTSAYSSIFDSTAVLSGYAMNYPSPYYI